VPPRVADLVDKALQKDRSLRYQTAAELLRDLTDVKRERDDEHVRGRLPPRRDVTSVPEVKSVAVLPFANMSADEDNEHLCDGLAEELLTALAKLDQLKVAARTSAFSFKGKSADVATIARTLGVNTVVDGSIRRAGNRLRISVQLINAADG